MRLLLHFRTLIFAALIAGPLQVRAQPPPCTTLVPADTDGIDETWTAAGSPYCVTEDVLVSLLTIEPGVEVLVDGSYQIEVLSITVAGSEDSPVRFAPRDPETQTWQGMLIRGASADSSLTHFVVEGSGNSGIRIQNSNPVIRNCIVRNNTAQSGGGLNVVLDADPPLTVEIRECEIVDNQSTIASTPCSGSNNGGGGGIFARVSTGRFILEGSEVRNNQAGVERYRGNRTGGGVHIEGTATISNSVISNNAVDSYRCACSPCSGGSVSRGGGVYANGDVTIENSVIQGNTGAAGTCCLGFGAVFGTGLYMDTGRLMVRNSKIIENLTVASAVFINTAHSRIVNSTIASNEGIGLANESAVVELLNSIVYFNNEEADQLSGTINATYSNIQNGQVLPGEGNKNVAPGLNPAFSIVPGSTCIDAGNPDPAFDDICFPPSLGTTANDMGADGGPFACRNPVPDCGNGVTAGAEECDDGNSVGGDGCSASCRVELCGNGIPDVGEECDDGNLEAGDGCDASCRSEPCVGDCDVNGEVSVDELVAGARIALGEIPLPLCTALDRDRNQKVSVDELVGAVSSALHGCGFESPE